MSSKQSSQLSDPPSDLFNLIWKSIDSIRGISDVAEYRDFIFALLFLKFASDLKSAPLDNESIKSLLNVPKDTSFYSIYEQRYEPNLTEIIERASFSFEEANPRLAGIFENIRFHLNSPRRQREDLRYLLRELLELLANPLFNLGSVDSSNQTGELFSFLIDKFSRSEGFRGGEFYTPQNLLPLIVKLLQPKAGTSLYDPTVGTGGLLIAANQFVKENEGDNKKLELFGQDILQEVISLAKMNLFFHQIFDATTVLGDTLRVPLYVEDGKPKKFDYVLSNPPISVHIRPDLVHELERDHFHRFPFGIPGRSADFLFLQHIITSLKENGRAIVIVPSGILFRTGREGDIRKKIIESDLIEAIVALGPGLLTNTSIPINLLIINKAKTKERENKILLINATGEYERAGRLGNFINEMQQSKILSTYAKFESIESFASVVGYDEIRENDFNLLPTRYIKLFPLNDFLGGKVTWQRFSNLVERFEAGIPIKLSEVEGNIPIIRTSDLSNRRLSIDNLQKATLPEKRVNIPYVQTGDILLSYGGTIRTFLADVSINGATIGQNLYIIRLKPEFAYLGRYIVEFLRSDKGYNLLSGYFVGASMPILRLADLKNIEIPIPDQSVIQLITNIDQVENELIQRVEKAQGLRIKLFNITDPEVVQKQLDELGTDAQILSSSLVQADSLDYQVRNFYPFPLAYPYRTLSATSELSERYKEQLRVAENLLVFLATTGLTLAESCNVLKNPSTITFETIKDAFAGGISPGHWQSLAFAAGKALRGQRQFAISDSFSALWFKGTSTKESEFAKAVKRLVVLKNDYKHDRGPKVPYEFSAFSKELQDHLDNCYSQLSFFVKYPIRLVQSLDVTWQTNLAILETLVYSGDHPGLRQEKIEHPKPLTKDILYLELDKGSWAPLYPHISVHFCQSCKTRETYFIDSWDGGGSNKIRLKSFERGHVLENDTEAKRVATNMENWVTNSLVTQKSISIATSTDGEIDNTL